MNRSCRSLAAQPVKPVPGEGAAGEWIGALDVGPMKLRLALHVEKKGEGGLGAGLNHLFQHAGTGGFEEYATIEETFAPEALTAIGDWIVARFSRGAQGAI